MLCSRHRTGVRRSIDSRRRRWTRQPYARGDSVVAEQRGVWRAPATGEIVGEADVATWFRVASGRVGFLARYDQLAEALAAAGLSEGDHLDESDQ
jgi:hypothetical protein